MSSFWRLSYYFTAITQLSMVCPVSNAPAHLGLIAVAGTFEYEEYISLRSINDPNEGLVKASASLQKR